MTPASRPVRVATLVLTLYIGFVFVQSLFFKFPNSPETQYIFGTLDALGASLGFPGLFAPRGVFSQYVVNSAELVASLLLLVGRFARKPPVLMLRALVALDMTSLQPFLHLFSPLHPFVQAADAWRRARPWVERARAAAGRGAACVNERESVLLGAFEAWADGRPLAALARHLEVARRWPRDLLNAKVAQIHQLNH